MASIFSLYGNIFVENEEANKKIKDTTEKGKNSSKTLGQSLGETAKKIGSVGKTIATGLGIGAAAITGLVEGTKEYRNSMAGLTTAFETNNLTSEQAKNTYKELYGILGDTGKAKESAQFLGMLANNEKELAEWTNIATGVYSQFGDALPLEGLTEAVNHTAKLGSVQGNLADALEWSGINVDDFNAKLEACNTETEREQLIRETLNATYDEASQMYQKNNEEIIRNNEAQAELIAKSASIGEALQPLVTRGKELLVEVLDKLMPILVQLANSIFPLILSLIEMLMPLFTEVVDAILPLLVDLINQVLPPIIEIVKQLLPVIVELIKILLPPLIQIIQALLPPLLEILDALMPLLEPILDVLAWAIDTILVPIIDVISSIVNLIGKVLTKTIQGLTPIVKGLLSVFKDVFGAIFNVVKIPINNIIDGINTFIRALNKVKVPDWVPGVGGKGINLPLIKKLKVGIDYVPYDEMPSLLHKGEMVLTKEEAQEYRKGKNVVVAGNSLTKQDIEEAFKEAIKSFKGKVVLDDREVGKFIIDTMEGVVYG